MLAKRYRLRDRRVFQAGNRTGLKCFKSTILMAISVQHPQPAVIQWGIVINKKVHKRAVVRNRIRRRLKALIAAWMRTSPVLPPQSLILIVHPAMVEATFDEMKATFHQLQERLLFVSGHT